MPKSTWAHRIILPSRHRRLAEAYLREQGLRKGEDYHITRKPFPESEYDVLRFRDGYAASLFLLWRPATC